MQATVFYVISTLLTVIPPFLINFSFLVQATVFYVISFLMMTIPSLPNANRTSCF